MNQLALSLFPGADLLGLAFEMEGFAVVQGPDVIFGRDIRNFHVPAGRFDGVIGGPPCQPFTRLRHLIAAKGQQPHHPNLIPEFERCVSEARPSWFVMENVPDAPLPEIAGYSTVPCLVNDAAVGGLTSRDRRITFGSWGAPIKFYVEVRALWRPDPMRAITGDAREVPVKIGGTGKYKGGGMLPNTGRKLATREMCAAQGLPEDHLSETPFTENGRRQAIGNGVPLSMGRAIAQAVKRALGLELAA